MENTIKTVTYKKPKVRLEPVDIILYTIMFLFLIIELYPYWFVLIGAFSDGNDYGAGGVYLFPRVFSLDSFRVVFNDTRLYTTLGLTVARTVLGTGTALIFTAMVSYGMH
ncbi:MAG: hypothetical protein IKT32_06115, partial [Clostridia bacterium]|nr:hypothetical protein [Clostridia bacterium]